MAFQIIVCIKSVIMRAPTGKVLRASDTCELNPFDRPALEMAMRLKEEFDGTVTALSMGPPESVFILHEAMAMGVDQGVLVSDRALADSDTLATSTALAAAIKKLSPFDLLLFGTRTADSDTGQVGPETGILLDLPMITGIQSIEKEGQRFVVERRVDGFWEKYLVSLPALLTVHPSSVEPRDTDLLGIVEAYRDGDIKTWNLADVELSSDRVGAKGSPTKVLSLSPVKKGKQCEFIPGTNEEQAEELVKRLAESGLI